MSDLIDRNFAIGVIMEQPGNMDKKTAKELLLRIPLRLSAQAINAIETIKDWSHDQTVKYKILISKVGV